MAFGFYTEKELKGFGARKVGKNIIVSQAADLVGIDNMEFGDNVVIEGFCIVSALGEKPVIFGSHIHINTHCLISGSDGVVMEDFSGLSSGVKIFSSSDDYTGLALTNCTIDDDFKQMTRGTVRIGRHCVIGANAVIMPGVQMGEGATVGALAFVNRDCAPWGIYAGVPAKRIKERKQDLLKKEREFLKWYSGRG